MRRIKSISAVALGATICLSGTSTAQAPQPDASAETLGASAETDFVRRCNWFRDVYDGATRRFSGEQTCRRAWERVVAAVPVADAILAAAPSQPGNESAASVQERLSGVEWGAAGEFAASGRLGGVGVFVDGDRPANRVVFLLTGRDRPPNVIDALKARGADVAELFCNVLGGDARMRMLWIAPPGGRPFLAVAALRYEDPGE